MSYTEIWDNDNNLLPIKINKNNIKKNLGTIIVNRDRPDKLVEQVNNIIETDIYVVEMGSKKESKYKTISYKDHNYRGKCYGHNVGLRLSLIHNNYKYFLFLMNDIEFLTKDSIKNLIKTLEENKKIGLVSPCEPNGLYPDCKNEFDRNLVC